ncbi:MAG: rRNA (cytosine967-C5)-methyltransferase [Thermoleophilaceae bacterium]|nr:rRNA (cytosine967-C5)-methyltransferase [Thermoleophilaceae bacterium]MEA2470252.1 rRNA (cytosine967-C5)-methyltransferase [Thermoleophilaceae bacterium]
MAQAVLRRVFDEGAFADRAFRAEADRAGLDPRDRAFAQQLAYGAVQRRAMLDHLIASLSSRPVEKLDPPVRDALRLGLFQLLFLDGVADHAAVSESVDLAGRGRGLVNAVLRRAQRERDGLLGELHDDTPEAAAVMHSHPEWLVRMWWDQLGADETRALLERDNQPAESAVRVNTLRADTLDLGIPTHPAPDLPEGLVLDAALDVHGTPSFERGELMPQSRGSMLVSRVLDPQPGERVLDLCAAPGAKTTHIAALMEGRGEVVAVEAHAGRARALEENARRLGVPNLRVVVQDAAEPVAGAAFDRVLLDPPCSDLGTLQARPDVRWRKDPALIERVAAQQAELLEAAAAQVRPGGVLVYSTCTISARENEEQMAAFLSKHPEFAAAREPIQLLPHRDGTDGFFIARLERAA